ncbi:MAG: hypothetical protein D6808_07005 [Candidatus Dadabacteria bacterium]|nr:MAG: hypothetical protein D6808_07005 [Candidatus Dadabacteria bacterium]
MPSLTNDKKIAKVSSSTAAALDAPSVDVGGFRQFLSALKGEWLSRLGSESRSKFIELQARGEISLSDISGEELLNLYNEDRLFFREEQLHRNVLRSIKLPLDPTKLGATPIILVELPDNKGFLIMNGNHRVYKVMESADFGSNSVYLVKMSARAFEEVFGMEVRQRVFDGHIDWGCPWPTITDKKRTVSN